MMLSVLQDSNSISPVTPGAFLHTSFCSIIDSQLYVS